MTLPTFSTLTSHKADAGFRLFPVVALACIGLATSIVHVRAADGGKPSSLPGGASTLSETFEDWTVSCSSANGATQCVISQTQAQKNGQRVLDVRLSPVADQDGNNASLTLPFGLEFARGVTAQLDDDKPGKVFSFKTCLPGGCIVPLSIDKAMIDAMRKGTALKLAASSIQNTDVPFTVSLKGFGAALDRATALVTTK